MHNSMHGTTEDAQGIHDRVAGVRGRRSARHPRRVAHGLHQLRDLLRAVLGVRAFREERPGQVLGARRPVQVELAALYLGLRADAQPRDSLGALPRLGFGFGVGVGFGFGFGFGFG